MIDQTGLRERLRARHDSGEWWLFLSAMDVESLKLLLAITTASGVDSRTPEEAEGGRVRIDGEEAAMLYCVRKEFLPWPVLYDLLPRRVHTILSPRRGACFMFPIDHAGLGRLARGLLGLVPE
jgi:hypothetical protein